MVACCPIIAAMVAGSMCSDFMDSIHKQRRAEARTVKPLPPRTAREARISLDDSTPPPTSRTHGDRGFRKILPMRYGPASKLPFVNSQSTSPFFRLPFELREVIYTLLLANFAIYPIKRSGVAPPSLLSRVPAAKMRHVRYKRNRDRDGRVVSMSSQGWIARYMADRERPARVGVEGEGGSMVDLLLCCRRVYGEAVDVVYARNVFHFYYVEDLMDFVSGVPVRRMERMECVTVHYWAEMEWLKSVEVLVTVLDGLRGLRRLELKVEGPWGEERGLVELIERVRGDVMVEVELRRCTKELLRNLEECTRENLRVVNSSNVRLNEEDG